ncbi:GAF domain-containing protein [Oscillatoriales cyanobacterium LEGE 11467]|uniref:Circadian input-output histidine kinase CikA n=1 Tax=Zarconia navalis LEGE 11467 TaxID=1828826 RepID=A0A928W3J7_9CYAN|nr:ATP-binding protein [Zarconia navalis]MBE9042555.1 GAF domain-containing protein [Zarconia navalis LEGE 11467]
MGSKRHWSPTLVRLLTRITTHIRESLELQTILDTTVAEVRSFLKVDRVKIYKFDSDGNGQVVAEARAGDRLASLSGLHFPAGDIPPQARELFCKARVRSIVNVDRQELRLSEPGRGLSTATEELSVEEVREQPLQQLLARPVDSCHVEYLQLMGVQSSMVIPIIRSDIGGDARGDRLWGLLIAHHAQPKSFSAIEQKIVGAIAEQLEIAIEQASAFGEAQDRARREATINQITTLLYSPAESKPDLKRVLDKIVFALQACGGLLCWSENGVSHCYSHGSIPQLTPQDWTKYCQTFTAIEQPFTTTDIYRVPQFDVILPSFRKTDICGAIFTPLQYAGETLGELAVFRPSLETERLWAGDCESDTRQNRPRQSFEQWREIVKGQAPQWTTGDRKLLTALAGHLAIALLQERLYRRERQQRILVEMRNRELDEARRAAEQANRLKSDFLASTNHELRTPLASILTYLKLLHEGFYNNEEELKAYIDAAHLSAENLTEIVNSVLDIAKIEADRMTVETTQFELASFLDRIRRIFQPESNRRGISLSVDCQLDRLYSDENKLRQVLMNLLSNAFKFTEAGEIRIEVARQPESDPPMVRFSIVDTGLGIEVDRKETLFEAFVQEDGSIRRRYGGTGLGLTICKKFIEMMGGRIEITSDGKNKGTTVSIWLPDGCGEN